MNLQPGHVIGSYQVGEEIGRGGRAVVYRSWQSTIGRWVALKVLRKRDPRVLEAFHREAQLTANLGHGSVRRVYDAGQTPDGYPFLAMQFVDTSLRQILHTYQEQGRTFSRQEVVHLLKPVAGVLDHIHSRGIVHLDIKPENILIFQDGQAVLADFGSACQIGSTTHEGTPRYFSPEQAAGDRPVGPQSDLYSLAVVAYEMLTGQLPFGSEIDVVLVRQHLEETPRPLRQASPHLPRDLEKIIGDALSKDPRQRPASARAFVEQIGTGADGPVAGGRKGNLRDRLGPLGSAQGRHWGLLIAATIVLIPLLLSGMFIVRSLLVTPTPTCTPTITPSPTATSTSISTPSPTRTETPVPTATPRPTSTPTPTRPPPTWTPTPTPSDSARPARPGAPRPPHCSLFIVHCSLLTYLSQETAPRSLAQGGAHG